MSQENRDIVDIELSLSTLTVNSNDALSAISSQPRSAEFAEVRSEHGSSSHSRVTIESVLSPSPDILGPDFGVAPFGVEEEEAVAPLIVNRRLPVVSRGRNISLRDLENLGFSYNQDIDYRAIRFLSIGAMDKVCPFCQALRFEKESENICCSKGKVRLNHIPPIPDPTLLEYFSGAFPASKSFLENIRTYNMCFNMTSFGADIDRLSGWMPTFRIQGQVHHRIGSLYPLPQDSPRFLQIYFMGDANMQIDQRTRIFSGADRNLVSQFQTILLEHNGLIRQFKTNLEQITTDQQAMVIFHNRAPAGEHPGRYNAPTCNEVAVVLVDGELSRRDIVIQRRNRRITRIYEMHPSYDALQYPLIFWQGQVTYDMDKLKLFINNRESNRRVSICDYYAYQFMVRRNNFNYILKCRSLLNQFATDMWAKAEGSRLRFIREHQRELLADQYIHLRDAINNDGDARNVGQRIILPATFTGSPRHMHEYTQDALSYVRRFGRPDLFITFTCNPTWDEIRDNLFENQTSNDRYDIVARVFHLKQKKLIEMIKKNRLFGEVRCYIYTIEWQKRGLPHSHSLIWLRNRIRPEEIDFIISAELPDPCDAELYNTVTRHMIHGPCGDRNPSAPCMDLEKRKCSKKYPRQFVLETISDGNGYPLYRRRSPTNGGQVVQREGMPIIDNRDVVPHNRVLCRMFNAHINVEYCHSVKSIKYICKYVNKGSDAARFRVVNENENDEIDQYLEGRYISSNEAFWRLFTFPIHDRSPAVVHLAVHLENGQRVYFTEENAAQRAAAPPRTTLTAFFEACRDIPLASTLLYSEMPENFTFNLTTKRWNERRNDAYAIGRLYSVHPCQTECFHLRILLTKIRGPTSFESLRTVDGHVCATYKEACRLYGFLEGDSHWDQALEEASARDLPSTMRTLFAMIICNCNPSDPKSLWLKYRDSLSEDIMNRMQMADPEGENCDLVYNQALIIIEDKCLEMVGKALCELGLDSPDRAAVDVLNLEIARELNYDREAMIRSLRGVELLNQDQLVAYQTLQRAISTNSGGLFFIDAPGGTGKTFLLNLLLAYFRVQGKILLAVASSGIAATLLQGGKTAHTTFKLPLDLARQEHPTCNIARGSSKWQLLGQCSAIIWDECTMSHRRAFEAVDRLLRDVKQNDSIMGGLVVILGGDFRQTLPVIAKSTPAETIRACLKFSHLWQHVQKFSLTTNLRAQLSGDSQAQEFASHLIELGEGRTNNSRDDFIRLPHYFCKSVQNVDQLIGAIFPSINNQPDLEQYLSERAILAPKNDAVDSINATILNTIQGSVKHYYSIDRTVDQEASIHFPIEFLNSLHVPNVPPHHLTLKIGCPVILLRNIDPPRLCNGTRLCITGLFNNLIQGNILSGPYKGTTAFIPRIPIIPTDLIVDFKRIQFPVRLAYAMTINKSQGQSLKYAGVDLTLPCFSHGQLYVACSRVGSPGKLFILAPEEKTRNVVYQSALR